MASPHGIGSIAWSSLRGWSTASLLSVVLGRDAAEPDDLGVLATAIDRGGFVLPPTAESLARYVEDPRELEVLAAAFELARRASSAPQPAVVRRPADIAAIGQREIGGLDREHVLVIVCDAANRPIRNVIVSQGAVDRALFPVREILSAVLRHDGRAFALVHNHPSGDSVPGPADNAIGYRIASAAAAVGLRVIGHVVVSQRQWTAVAHHS